MNKYFIPLLLLIISACGENPGASPTGTMTLLPTETSTAILTSTVTPIILSGLEASLVGIGTHGNMICVTNLGNLTGLEISFTAQTKQEETVIETNLRSKIINAIHCFEITDLMYKTGVPVSVIISALENGKIAGRQELILGEYQIVPFLNWIFGENGLDTNVFGGFRDNHRAWDLAFSNDIYPNSVGTPISAVGDGSLFFYNYWFPKEIEMGYCSGYYAWLPDVGVLWQFGHTVPNLEYVDQQKLDVLFNTGDIVTYIDKNQDSCSSSPHVHLAFQTVIMDDLERVAYDHPDDSYINPFIHDPLDDGSFLETGLWLPDTLPDSVKELFLMNFFEIKTTSTTYHPTLSR